MQRIDKHDLFQDMDYLELLGKVADSIDEKNSVDFLLLKGILDGEDVFTGPDCVEIDITDSCNMNCISCWQHHPGSPYKASNFIPLEKLKEIADDSSDMGVRSLRISGGEPLLHPEIVEFISYSAACIKEITLVSNGSILTHPLIDRLSDAGLKRMWISLWAGSSDTYQKTHPGVDGNVFDAIIDSIKYILDNTGIRIMLVFVISKYNHYDIQNMIDLSVSLQNIDAKFVMADTIQGTEGCLLDRNELEVFRKNIESMIDSGKAGRFIDDIRLLLSSISSPGALQGNYNPVDIGKRCYLGWIYTRIRSDGSVNPCCSRGQVHIGNIYQSRLSEIWYSDGYKGWRRCLRSDVSNCSIIQGDINCLNWRLNRGIESSVNKFGEILMHSRSSPNYAVHLLNRFLLEKSSRYDISSQK